ncbi:hypothetical protein HAX54_033644, partial [Datura stramonium]|nr:hypothetical protein [Datura stramonium]
TVFDVFREARLPPHYENFTVRPTIEPGGFKQVSWHQKLTKERKWRSLTKVSSGFQNEKKGRVSSAAKGTPTRMFRAKVVEPHGLTWLIHKRRLNMLWRTGLTKAASHLSSLLSVTRSSSWDRDISLPSLRSTTSL